MKLPEDPFIRELLPEFVDTWIQDIGAQFTPLIEEKNCPTIIYVSRTRKAYSLAARLTEDGFNALQRQTDGMQTALTSLTARQCDVQRFGFQLHLQFGIGQRLTACR